MITAIIFSKNRPLQLDLCLKSIQKNFLDCNEIIVLEKYSDIYSETIRILKNEHKDIALYKQKESIYADILDILTCCKNKYVCFFTDDDIFYSSFSTNNYDKIFHETNNVCTLSLRLGLNINKRFHQGKQENDIPYSHQVLGEFFAVPKTFYPYGSYWSYSHSVDGHIFRKNDALRIFDELSFLDGKYKLKQTPNEVETQMQRYWALSENNIICPLRSVVVNTPNNRVSDTHAENAFGENFNYDPEYLLGVFIKGRRIHFDLLDFNDVDCPHKELDIIKGIL